jgi:hypothetical protein
MLRSAFVTMPGVAPPGWSAFDPQRVDELRRSAKSADAPCPFKARFLPHRAAISGSAATPQPGTLVQLHSLRKDSKDAHTSSCR